MLKNKTIIIGVTGCIAAYKAAEIVRILKKLGAEVWVAMTAEAAKLVTPLTFRTLSGNPVITDLFSEELSNLPVPHISLTQKADLIVVAPATANILAKASAGIASDALSTMILSAKCPVVFAPAMNSAMWENPATEENVLRLKERGFSFIGPEQGELACGDEGMGRLASVGEIVDQIKIMLAASLDLLNARIIVTAGPTREAIDPVRYISNRSSGKMGYAVAEAAAKRGASVTLISGPTDIERPSGVELICTETAREMSRAVLERYDGADAVIMAAAVADFRPKEVSKQKIKKGGKINPLELESTEDILRSLGQRKGGQVLVGFSLETEDHIKNSAKKMEEKNLDLIVANDSSALGSDLNLVTIIGRDGKMESLSKLNKAEVASKILDKLSPLLIGKILIAKLVDPLAR